MDRVLLEKIKSMTNSKGDSNILCFIDDIQRKIELLANRLYKIKLEKTIDDISFMHQKDLIDSINSLGQITSLLISEQKANENKTNNSMEKRDSGSYFEQKKERKVTKKLIENDPIFEKELAQLLMQRKKDYIEAFGYFESREKANIIIKKEFDDVIRYVDVLLKINEIKFEPFDNYDPLINVCQNLMYELSQLVIVLNKAEESKIVDTLNNPRIKNIKAYFILMDFVNSRELYPDNVNILSENIKAINRIIESSPDVGLLCNMDLHKQDEIQGIFIGDVSKFIDILSNNLVKDVKYALSEFVISDDQKDIADLSDSIYNDPFIFTGPTTWKARTMIETSPGIIKALKIH